MASYERVDLSQFHEMVNRGSYQNYREDAIDGTEAGFAGSRHLDS